MLVVLGAGGIAALAFLHQDESAGHIRYATGDRGREQGVDLALHPLAAVLDEIEKLPDPEARVVKLDRLLYERKRDIVGSVIEPRYRDLASLAILELDESIRQWREEMLVHVDELRGLHRYGEAYRLLLAKHDEAAQRSGQWNGRDIAKSSLALIRELIKVTLPNECHAYVDQAVMRSESLAALGDFDAAHEVLSGLGSVVIERDLFDIMISRRIAELENMREEYAALGRSASSTFGLDEIRARIKPAPELNLPQGNPLLPNGQASEDELTALVFSAFVERSAPICAAYKTIDRGGVKRALHSVVAGGINLVAANGASELVPWRSVETTIMLAFARSAPFKEVREWVGLALVCFGREQIGEASECLAAAYAADNSVKEALDALLSLKRRMPVPDGGFVIHAGRLMAPFERDREELEARITKHLTAFSSVLGCRAEDIDYTQADEVFTELLAFADLSRGRLIGILAEKRSATLQRLEDAAGLLGDTKQLHALKLELDKRRKHALSLIDDGAKWPYPHGPNDQEVTAEVLERLKAVEEVWNNPFALKGKAYPDVDHGTELVIWIDRRLSLADPGNLYHEPTGESDIAYIRSLANHALDIKGFALSSAEKNLIVYNRSVVDELKEQRGAFSGKKGAPTQEAWEQCEITNEFRMMMGLRALKFNFKLYWSCYYHSKYCVEHNGGLIAHFIKGEPRGEGPSDRARFEGFPAPVGENVCLQPPQFMTARTAHEAWVASSGHCRNLLTPMWMSMGSGRFESVWTQAFSVIDEGDGNYRSNGGK